MAGVRQVAGDRASPRRLSAEDHRIVTEAVTAAERGTDAEIVTIVADRSDDYRDVGLLFAALAALLLPMLAALAPATWESLIAGLLSSWDGSAPAGAQFFAIMAAQALVFLAIALIMSVDRVRFALTPAPYRRQRVRARAIASFRVGAEARTEARHGLLVYVSLRERMAELIVDDGLMRHAGDEVWAVAMADLVRLMRKGSPGQAIAAAISDVGGVLASIAPKTAGDRDELPDRLIEL